MSVLGSLIGPIAGLIDKIIPDPEARDKAKLELLRLQGAQELETVRTQLTAIARGMTAYLNAIPEPLYVLFGTGYLGYTAARSWGKAKGLES